MRIRHLVAAAVLVTISSPALSQDAAAPAIPTPEIEGDASAGEASFRKCETCHAVGHFARNRIGPVLNGVVGRQAGTYEGYIYSAALTKAGEEGLIWTPDELAEYIREPKARVPGNKMAFIGIKDDAERDNIIAYLISISPDYGPAAPAQ